MITAYLFQKACHVDRNVFIAFYDQKVAFFTYKRKIIPGKKFVRCWLFPAKAQRLSVDWQAYF